MSRAAFLDRDGVLNELALNAATRQWESPKTPEELRLAAGAAQALKALRAAGFSLLVVSNQPDAAKGKATPAQLRAVHDRFVAEYEKQGVSFDGFYYCYHHPDGTEAPFAGPCECRKPSPYFLKKAAQERGLSLPSSWMVGDRDTDVRCGAAAGCRTALVADPRSADYQGKSRPDLRAATFGEAVAAILARSPA